MKDKNGIEIQVGHLVKRCGNVEYADGKRFKISKKTWLVSNTCTVLRDTADESKQSEEHIFYRDDFSGEEVELKRPKDEGNFIVVGDIENGLDEKFRPEFRLIDIAASSVEEKYRVLKDVEDQNWKTGDIVQIFGKVSRAALEDGWLEKVDKETPHKHVLIVVDPILMNPQVNQVNE